MHVCSVMLAALSATATVIRGVATAYCDDNLFPEDGIRRRFSGVQFTKELSAFEYGPKSSFKTLHCCGERYLSIEWFKDNLPYPWPGDVSSFILNPESANQTIYTQSLTSSDHGVYICQMTNQTHLISHSMKLFTFEEKSYWRDPLPTYQIPKEHYVLSGDLVRLYCEGYVGKVELPDAVNTITWTKISIYGNETIEPNNKYKIKKVIRENEQVLGAFLIINQFEENDYGQYICSISNTGDQNMQQFTNITKPIALKIKPSDKKVHSDFKVIIFVMAILILIVWNRRFFCFAHRMLKKKIKVDKYALSEKNVLNIIVFYDEENKESVQYLMAQMEHRNNYITNKFHTDFNEDFMKIHTDLAKGYDFAIYLLSSDITVTPSLMTKLTQPSLTMQENTLPKKYIIDCGNMSATPAKSLCDRVLLDLSSESMRKNQNTPNKSIRIV